MNNPKNIIIHHTAVSMAQNSMQFDAVKKYHVGRGWGNIGYHFFIEPNGRIKPGRAENEVGAHCYAQGMNFQSVGVCLAGNFEIEKPTKWQIYALRDLLRSICPKYNIKDCNIWFHRDFAATACPGRNLDRGFIRSLIKPS
jgi:N-acetyl-anhydromuramyl-L-alanine amidase AmpD